MAQKQPHALHAPSTGSEHEGCEASRLGAVDQRPDAVLGGRPARPGMQALVSQDRVEDRVVPML